MVRDSCEAKPSWVMCTVFGDDSTTENSLSVGLSTSPTLGSETGQLSSSYRLQDNVFTFEYDLPARGFSTITEVTLSVSDGGTPLLRADGQGNSYLVVGCLDPTATNHAPESLLNSGTCVYPDAILNTNTGGVGMDVGHIHVSLPVGAVPQPTTVSFSAQESFDGEAHPDFTVVPFTAMTMDFLELSQPASVTISLDKALRGGFLPLTYIKVCSQTSLGHLLTYTLVLIVNCTYRASKTALARSALQRR